MLVKEIMTTAVKTVKPQAGLHDLAVFFIENDISGAPVIDDSGRVLGAVLEDDLIHRDKKLHLPTLLYVFNGVISFGEKKLEEEMKRISAASVAEIMRKDPDILSPDDTVEEAATLIADRGKNYFIVMDGDKLAGVLTKKDIVRAIAENKLP